MNAREGSQLLLSFGGQLQQDAPCIPRIGFPANQLQFRHSIHQLHGGVMPDQEEARDVPNTRGLAAAETLDRKQRLVLLRRQSGALGRSFAECQEGSQLIAKLRQRRIVGLPHRTAL
jgi:hypothetical protein